MLPELGGKRRAPSSDSLGGHVDGKVGGLSSSLLWLLLATRHPQALVNKSAGKTGKDWDPRSRLLSRGPHLTVLPKGSLGVDGPSELRKLSPGRARAAAGSHCVPQIEESCLKRKPPLERMLNRRVIRLGILFVLL